MSDQKPNQNTKPAPEPRGHLGPLVEEIKDHLETLNLKHDPAEREEITSHRPGVGSLIVSIKNVFAKLLQPFANIILRRQAVFNAQLVQLLNKMIPHLNHELLTFRDEVEHLNSELRTLGEYSRLKISELRQENILIKQRFERILSEMREKYDLPQEAVSKIVSEQETLWDHDYFRFENQFRGDQEDIRKRQEVYLPLFKNSDHVLDIGCGRGEFLEILKKEGIQAVGIDLNEDMIHICKQKGLEIEKKDAFDYLNSIADESLGGIFAAHIIEHLQMDSLRDFIKLCHRKLKRGSPLAFETPNPLSIIVSSTSFYLDLSHIKPLHPEAMKFLVESCGFKEIEIKYLSPFTEEEKFQPLLLPEKTDPTDAEEKNFRLLDKNLQQLNKLLYGFQDYAVIARKV